MGHSLREGGTTTEVSKSQLSRLQNLLQKSHAKSAKRACCTRLLPQFISKTSVSRETSFKTHTSSLQNERYEHFVQDALQPCEAVSRFQPLQTTPAHTPIPMSQQHLPPPQLATSRLPAPATKVYTSTPPTRTKYCTCHEM